jgi:hypothetical protein
VRIIIALILAVLVCAPVRANDSTAALATGGLVFVRNPDVEIRAEDLFISPMRSGCATASSTTHRRM